MAAVKTKNIINFAAQMDRRWPNRDHTSDGWIGDAAHQAETSGHNPDDTAGSKPAWDGDADTKQEVRAYDADSDLREAGSNMQMVVDHLIKLPGFSSVCRYLIYNHYWWHYSDGFTKKPYSGASAHEEHLHYEGAWSDAADENGTFDFRLDEVGVNMDWTDKPWSATAVRPISVADALQSTYNNTANVPTLIATVSSLSATLAQVLANVVADDGEKAAILADAQAKHAEVLASISNIDDTLFAKLSDPTTPDEETAQVILSLIADRPGVLAALQAA